MFLDESKIEVIAGDGGDGAVTFRQEKFVPRGGPSGGNGGRGGHVIFRASKDLHTLYDIGQKRLFKAGNGGKGGTADCTGRGGADIILKVPVGTVVKDLETGEQIADLKVDGQEEILAAGGGGGLGNAAFRSSRNQTPRKFTPGKPGQCFKLQLELKFMADCGLVGFPNAGKSSMLRRVSSATPKVADYPFTTLAPVLGVVSMGLGSSFVMVDIPGLIEKASEGKGLGHRFLRHIERTHCLVFILDASEKKPYKQFKILTSELEKFHPLLLKKPRLIALNKNDLGNFPIPAGFKKEKCPVLRISALTGEGLEAFKKACYTLVRSQEQVKDEWEG